MAKSRVGASEGCNLFLLQPGRLPSWRNTTPWWRPSSACAGNSRNFWSRLWKKLCMWDSCLSYGMKYILHHIWNEDRQIQSRICASVVVTIATSINAAKCPIAHIYKDGIDIVGFIAPVHVSDVDLVFLLLWRHVSWLQGRDAICDPLTRGYSPRAHMLTNDHLHNTS